MRLSDYDTMYSIEIAQMKRPKVGFPTCPLKTYGNDAYVPLTPF